MRLRDIHLARVVFRQLVAGRSVFSWYGLHHTLALSKCFAQFGDACEPEPEYQALNQNDRGEGYIFNHAPHSYQLNNGTHAWQFFSRPHTPEPRNLLHTENPLHWYHQLEELSRQPLQANTYITSLTDYGQRWHKNFTSHTEIFKDIGIKFWDNAPSTVDAEVKIAQMLASLYPQWHSIGIDELEEGDTDNPQKYQALLARAFTRLLSILNPPTEEQATLVISRLCELFDLYIDRTLTTKGKIADAIATFDVTSLHFTGFYDIIRMHTISQDLPSHLMFECMLRTINALAEGKDYI